MNSTHFIIIFSCLLLVLPGLSTGSEGTNSVVNLSYTDNTPVSLLVPDVLSLLTNPDRYLGKTIRFKGIVTKTYPLQHLFTVADRVGCSICVAKNARNSIMVSYQGEIPKSRETVQVSGLLTNDPYEKYVVNATSVVI